MFFCQPFFFTDEFLFCYTEIVRKESVLVIFYILYFLWLATVTYLTIDTYYLNLFTIGVITFYFILLREKLDLVIFIGTTLLVAIILSSDFNFARQEINFNDETLRSIPLWIVLSWSTTVLAMRKLIAIVYR